MEPGSIWWFILLAILLAADAFLALARVVFSSRRVKALCGSGDDDARGMKALARVMKDVNKLKLAILFGHVALQTITTLMLGFYAFAALRAPLAAAVLLAYLLLVLVLCALLPRAAAKRCPERIAPALAPLMRFYMFFLCPFMYALSGMEHLFHKLFGVTREENTSAVTEEELITIVNASSEGGVLKDEEREMINNVFAFGDARAKDVMTPRMDIVALPATATSDEALDVFKREQFSRVPVYREDLDHIIGILHFKDLVFAQAQAPFSLEDIMREPLFTYESKLTSELFAQMRSMSSPLAVVLDEYGGTAGIVTLEDMVEEIVGDIMDEYDEEEDVIELVRNAEYVTDGAVKIDEFNEMAGTSLMSEDYDSIGGYVIGLLGDIPKQNEIIIDEPNRITFTVTALDKNRIEKLHVLLHPLEINSEKLDK